MSKYVVLNNTLKITIIYIKFYKYNFILFSNGVQASTFKKELIARFSVGTCTDISDNCVVKILIPNIFLRGGAG